MDGNKSAKFTYLQDKAVEFGLQISHALCSKAQALYTFHSSFMKTLDYTTLVTQFSL